MSLFTRRRALGLLGGATAGILAGCSTEDSTAAGSSTATTPTAGGTSPIPQETAGPFPGDGSNGPNVLAQEGVVRQDIRSSFGSSTTTADGVPLSIVFELVDSADGAPLAGGAVHVWHCDRVGGYSLYSDGLERENYLRGVQEADADGRASFTSIFPGAYPGRWPHVHFSVYDDLEAATGGGDPRAISQIAIPEEACVEVYRTAGYEQSRRDLPRTTLQSDGVFRDDRRARQLGTVTGDVASGLTITLRVPV